MRAFQSPLWTSYSSFFLLRFWSAFVSSNWKFCLRQLQWTIATFFFFNPINELQIRLFRQSSWIRPIKDKSWKWSFSTSCPIGQIVMIIDYLGMDGLGHAKPIQVPTMAFRMLVFKSVLSMVLGQDVMPHNSSFSPKSSHFSSDCNKTFFHFQNSAKRWFWQFLTIFSLLFLKKWILKLLTPPKLWSEAFSNILIKIKIFFQNTVVFQKFQYGVLFCLLL